MSFCASCGRQRSGTARFCGGCGAEFDDAPADSGDQGASPADVAPDLTFIEPAADQPNPFASWYQQQQPQGAQDDADETWQPTQTVLATPTQATGYPPSGFTSANPFSSANPTAPPFPPAPSGPTGPPAGTPSPGGRRGLFIALAVVVVLAAGGGAYALATTLGKHSSAQPPTQPTAGASTPTAASPTAGTTQQASSPGTSPTPVPSPTLDIVSVAPGVPVSAAHPQVETLLSHYFHGINTHSYTEYASTLNPAEQANQTEAEFSSGYSSTTDSMMLLTSLTGAGRLTATVTFTSRQSPAQSVDKSACNTWKLNLYLVPQGADYLIGTAPSGYQPTYSDC